MHSIDIIIIAFYIILIVGIGIWFSKRASKGLDSYFLGGKSIKWYYLGLSNGSGMFDVSGTAWMVGILFLYGLKSFLFMWLWPIWNQIFIMMFLAVWIRRSNIMTGSEWILTRFGDKRAGRASHLIVAVFAIIATIGFIAYFFEGVGKFMTIILPWDLTLQMGPSMLINSEQSYALIIIFLTTKYCQKVNDCALNPVIDDNCYKEWNYSLFKNKIMIPVLMEPSMKQVFETTEGVIQMYLNNTLYIDMSKDIELKYKELEEAIKTLNKIKDKQKHTVGKYYY